MVIVGLASLTIVFYLMWISSNMRLCSLTAVFSRAFSEYCVIIIPVVLTLLASVTLHTMFPYRIFVRFQRSGPSSNPPYPLEKT